MPAGAHAIGFGAKRSFCGPLALRPCRRYPSPMRQRVVLAASLAACFALLSACAAGHFVRRGADLYKEGRYVEADEVFEHNERRVARAPLEQRAAYAAYRGATFLALGDLMHAQHWLNIASEIERAQPGTLRPSERAFLDATWQVLDRQLAQSPPAPVTSAIASSSQPPGRADSVLPSTDSTTQQRSLVPQ
jgi:hypothetical protein